MKSRYDFIVPSSVQDEVDNEYYPDILSLNLNALNLEYTPVKKELTDIDIQKFWLTTYKIYKTAEYDDMVLSLNGIPHKNFLKEDMVLYFPAIRDIENSFKKDAQ